MCEAGACGGTARPRLANEQALGVGGPLGQGDCDAMPGGLRAGSGPSRGAMPGSEVQQAGERVAVLPC